MEVKYVNAAERSPGKNGTYFIFIGKVKCIGFFKDGKWSGIYDVKEIIWLEII